MALALVVTTVITAQKVAGSAGGLYQLKIFEHLFARFDGPVAKVEVGILVFTLVAARFVRASWFDAAARWADTQPLRFGALALALLAFGARWSYDAYPLALDEFAQAFQAQIFATGRLHGQYPAASVDRLLPIPGEFIQYSPLTGQVMSGYWPGMALLLTPFTLLGVPWLANPVVGVIALLLVRRLTRVILPDAETAPGWAMWLMLASTAFFVNAISFYTMNVYLAVGMAYALLVLQPTVWRLVLAGLLGSLALVLHNPVTHVLFAAPWIVCLALGKQRVRNLSLLGVGYVPLVLIVGGGWFYLKSALARDMLAFHNSGAGMQDAASALASNGAFALPSRWIVYVRALATFKLAVWAVPGLVVAAVLGARAATKQLGGRLLLISAAVTYAFYFFVIYDQGHGWGYRYFHGVWCLVPIFGAAWITRNPSETYWRSAFGVLTAASLCILMPMTLINVRTFIHEAESMTPHANQNRRQVVFVNTNPGDGRYYAVDSIRNDPFLRTRTWTVQSQSPEADADFIRRHFASGQMISSDTHGTVWDVEESGPSTP